jgi:hypothetical protein
MGMNFRSALASLNVSAILERLESESQDVDPGYVHEVSARDYLLLVTAADQRFGGVSWGDDQHGDDVPWFRGYPVEVL